MKNVPKLRFKEFSSEWQAQKLGDFSAFSKGKGISKADIDPNGINPCIRYGELYTVYGEKIDNVLSKTNVDIKNLVVSEVNDIIIPASGETQIDIAKASCVLKSGIALGGDLNIIKANKNGVFLSYYLNSKKKLDIAKLAQGKSVVHLYPSQLEKLDVNTPSDKEQTKIADFLTAIDDRISQLSQKCDGLAQYKKGVMQKIFSQELRFKDEKGRAFGAWEEKRLGDLYAFKVTNSFSRENLNYENGTVKNIHYGDIHTKFSTLFDIAKERVPFINEDISLDKIKIENYCIEGDVIFADASEDLNDVGKSIEVVNLNGEKLLSGLHTLLARKAGDFFHVGFSGYLFKSDDVRVKIQREAQGSKVLSISATRLVNIKISIPSKPEQEKIAGFLGAVDEKISHAQAQLDALKQYKQGLLQQMFV